jgi:hypothetical protein
MSLCDRPIQDISETRAWKVGLDLAERDECLLIALGTLALVIRYGCMNSALDLWYRGHVAAVSFP